MTLVLAVDLVAVAMSRLAVPRSTCCNAAAVATILVIDMM
jgi:hypothetical protein